MQKTHPKTIVSLVHTVVALMLPVTASRAAIDDNLATVVDRSSHRASSFDTTGGNGDAVINFAPGQTLLLLDVNGPGKITHCWFTASGFQGHPALLRDVVLRIFWEGSLTPSVEVPLGDFFGLGHGREYQVQSAPINVGNSVKALNCYWPMPFYKHARLELVNNGNHTLRKVFYNIDYELGPLPPKQGLFHAEFRRVKELRPQPLEKNLKGEENYVILDARGEGQYVGCFLFVDSAPGGWWGEGDDMMFIDGEETPSINGTGTEDYFCNAWGFHSTFNYPYYGVPFQEKQSDDWTQTTAYRFHIPDPVRFKKSIRVTIEHGWSGKAANDFSSVAYWYQTEPNDRRQPLPHGADMSPRTHASKTRAAPTAQKICATQAEPALREKGVAARAVATSRSQSLFGGILQIDSPNKAVEIPVPVRSPGKYHIVVKLHDVGQQSPVTLRVKDGPPKTLEKIGKKRADIDLGEIEVGEDRTIIVIAESPAVFAIDSFLIDVPAAK